MFYIIWLNTIDEPETRLSLGVLLVCTRCRYIHIMNAHDRTNMTLVQHSGRIILYSAPQEYCPDVRGQVRETFRFSLRLRHFYSHNVARNFPPPTRATDGHNRITAAAVAATSSHHPDAWHAKCVALVCSSRAHTKKISIL